jgi:hypothetical protein
MAMVCVATVSAILAGCGGNSTGNATISGKVTGLDAGASVSIALNGGAAMTVSSNTNFSFSNTVSSNAGYSVVVAKQPANQTCVVNFGSGLVDFSGNNVTNVAVNCADNIPLSVLTTGLNSGNSVTFNLTLQNDAANIQSVSVSSNNTAVPFPISLPLGTIYNISVYLQPGQTVDKTKTPPVVSGSPTQVCTTSSTSSSGGIVSATPIVVDFNCQ